MRSKEEGEQKEQKEVEGEKVDKELALSKGSSIDELLKGEDGAASFDMKMIHACFKRLEVKVDASQEKCWKE